MSLNPIAIPAALEPGALVTLAQADGGEGRLERVRGAQVDPALGRVVVVSERGIELLGDLRGGLGPLRAVVGGER